MHRAEIPSKRTAGFSPPVHKAALFRTRRICAGHGYFAATRHSGPQRLLKVEGDRLSLWRGINSMWELTWLKTICLHFRSFTSRENLLPCFGFQGIELHLKCWENSFVKKFPRISEVNLYRVTFLCYVENYFSLSPGLSKKINFFLDFGPFDPQRQNLTWSGPQFWKSRNNFVFHKKISSWLCLATMKE